MEKEDASFVTTVQSDKSGFELVNIRSLIRASLGTRKVKGLQNLVPLIFVLTAWEHLHSIKAPLVSFDLYHKTSRQLPASLHGAKATYRNFDLRLHETCFEVEFWEVGFYYMLHCKDDHDSKCYYIPELNRLIFPTHLSDNKPLRPAKTMVASRHVKRFLGHRAQTLQKVFTSCVARNSWVLVVQDFFGSGFS